MPSRRLIIPLFALLLCIGFWSCSKKKTPETIAEQFYHTLYNEHDLEKAEQLVTESSRDKLHSDFKFIEGTLALLASEQEINYSFRALTEKTYTSGDSTFVFVWTSLDSSTNETLLFLEDGEYAVDFRYPANKQTTKSLTEDVLELMSDKVAKPLIDTAGLEAEN